MLPARAARYLHTTRSVGYIYLPQHAIKIKMSKYQSNRKFFSLPPILFFFFFITLTEVLVNVLYPEENVLVHPRQDS
jgi:hypothetical protein